jgi:hypothetical protein
MENRQQAALDRLARISTFLDDHATDLGIVSRSTARAQLTALVKHLTARAQEQVAAGDEFRLCARRRLALRGDLFGRHLWPIAGIAQAAFADESVAAQFTAPKRDARFADVLERADAIRAQAAKHRQVFVREGFEPDFVTQLRGVIAAMNHLGDERAERVRRGKAATAALAMGFRRAKGLVSVLHALVQSNTTGNPALRAEWEAVRRGKAAGPRLELVDSDAA